MLDNLLKQLVLIALCLVCMGLFSNIFSNIITDAFNGKSPADFPNYYFAGKRLYEGRDVYSPLDMEVKEAFGWKYDVYPADTPILLCLTSPLSFLPYEAAWFVLAGFSIITLTFSIQVLARELQLTRQASLVLCCLALASSPFLFLLKRNHVETVLLLLGVLGWKALRNNQHKLSGVLWGTAAALKLFPLIWLVRIPKNNTDKQILAYGASTFLALSILGCYLLGEDNSYNFFSEILPLSSRWYGVAGNYSLMSLSVALLGSSSGIILGAILTIVALIAFVFLLIKLKPNNDTIFILSTCFALLISPLSWLNYFILLFPALIILAQRIDFTNRALRITFLLICLVVWNWPSYISTGSPVLTVLVSSMPTFGVMGLVAFIYYTTKLTH
jgi:Glycosyltransferase family 87